MAVPSELDFEMYYIFPPEVFEDPVVGPRLGKTFLKLNSQGNMIPILKDASFAAAVREKPDFKRRFLEAGWSVGSYDPAKDDDSDYRRFVVEELRKIVSGGLSDADTDTAIFLFHKFCRSVVLQDGEAALPLTK